MLGFTFQVILLIPFIHLVCQPKHLLPLLLILQLLDNLHHAKTAIVCIAFPSAPLPRTSLTSIPPLATVPPFLPLTLLLFHSTPRARFPRLRADSWRCSSG